MVGTRSAHRSFLPWFALAIGVGLWLRLDQFAAQLLLEDEWHAVYRVVHDAPAAIFLNFAHSDSSIPLTLLYALESRTFGLSEIGMRLPLLLAGAATLILFPWYAARHVGRGEALVFAALLAISPLLYFFSRTARPYALTLLLAWIAHVAFRRYFEAQAPRSADAAGYAASATLAAWLHPVVGPFVVAPFVTAAWQCARRGPDAERRRGMARLAVLALATALPMAALLLPPLITHPESLRLKSGVDLPNVDTLIGVWYLWFGTGATAVVLICGALALHNVQLDFLTGAILPAQLYYKAQQVRELTRRQVFAALQQADVLALPGSSEPAALLPTEPGIHSKEEARQRMAGRRSFTGVFNLANVPALCVPCGFASVDGKDLPIGLQLAGKPFDDGLLLKVAHAYEQSTAWHTRRPPIA